MIVIDEILLSDEIVEEKFVCDLNACKGGCCEDGDAGAPLEDEECRIIEENFEAFLPYMTKEGIEEVAKKGKYIFDEYFGNVTPTINNSICAYGYRDKQGIIKCAIESAYYDGKLDWKKPISCHLFPIKTTKSSADENVEYLNYEPREDLCAAACKLGKKLKVPVYEFLKEPLIRRYGEDFFDQLHATALYMKEDKK